MIPPHTDRNRKEQIMENIEQLNRYVVQGIYQDVIYAKNEEEAKELFCEMNAICVREEGDFDQITVKPAPFK